MPAVKFGFDVRRHLDSVDHQVAHQPVDDGILHYHSDQTGASQVAFSEFGIGQVLVFECRHTEQYPSACRHPLAMAVDLPVSSQGPGRGGSNRARNRRASAPWCQDARTCRYGRRAHAQMALLCAAWAASRHAETAAHSGGSARCSWAGIPSRIVTVSMSMTSSSWSSRLPFLTICASYVGLIFQLTDGFAGRGRAQPPAWLPLAQTAVACQLVALLALTCPDRRRHG